MSEINLSQAEADALILMEKHRIDGQIWDYPDPGASIHIPLISANGKENFHLDMRRGKIDLAKGTYQNRSRQIIVLVRIDFGGQPHRNPDGQEITSPHIHIYKEGYGDKWAYPLPYEKFTDINDRWQMLKDFMQYCNITKTPKIERGLFS
jgi:hypothetical protein